jgi:hypothetical protein
MIMRVCVSLPTLSSYSCPLERAFIVASCNVWSYLVHAWLPMSVALLSPLFDRSLTVSKCHISSGRTAPVGVHKHVIGIVYDCEFAGYSGATS